MAWSGGRRPLGAALHSPDEPNELSQSPGHDDSTINIVVVIIIVSVNEPGVGRLPLLSARLRLPSRLRSASPLICQNQLVLLDDRGRPT